MNHSEDITFFQYIGRSSISFLNYVVMILALFFLSIKVLWTNRNIGHREFFKQILEQIYFTGVSAVIPVFFTALAVGTLAIALGTGGLGAQVTGAQSISRIVILVVISEIAPLLTGFIVIVRSITAITAQLGTMKIQREIEALEAMGISPILQFVTPKIAAGFISIIGLNAIFSAVALFCGFALSQILISHPASLFFQWVFMAVTPGDLLTLLLKISIGGLGIFTIACHHGMNVINSSTEIPVAVSKASLHSLFFLLATHIGISFLKIFSGSSNISWGALI